MESKNSNGGKFITLENEYIKITFCDIGASIVALFTKDRDGVFADVVLGYSEPKDYRQFGCYFGAVCGRVANRIDKGQFILNGQRYQLDINNGDNHLHGGNAGCSVVDFDYQLIEDNKIIFTKILVDGASGYPGNVEIRISYTLSDNNIIIDYYGVSDQDTILNLTNHSYFNLNGHSSGDILEHYLTINADTYIPINERCIPLGIKTKVDSTVFDFKMAKKIGKDINKEDAQLLIARGYDHSFEVNEHCATLYSKTSGRCLDVYTTNQGMQLYTGNWIDDVEGKGYVYQRNAGVALETQYHPDAVNQSTFDQPILRKGESYNHQTRLCFTIK